MGVDLKGLSKGAFIFLLFVALTVVMTWPLAVNMTRSVPGDTGDPLLNTWILAWDAHKILEFDFKGFFNANIFFPYKNTLAYSEHLFGNMVFALPVLLISKNPVLAYNAVFLSGIFLSGLSMYLLALHLTKDRLAAFTAGVVYGFFPWRFVHLGHLQMQVAEWIPLTFLYYDKFRDSLSYRHLLLFTMFFLLQFLSCGYYALFLGFFMGLLISLDIWRRGIRDTAFLSKIAVFAVVSGVVILPFFYPYIKIKREMGFSRSFKESVMFSADILSYFSTTNMNRLWGGIAEKLVGRRPEGELFLGLTSVIVAAIGILGMKAKAQRIDFTNKAGSGYRKALSAIILLLMAASLAQSIAVLYTGGYVKTVFGVNIRATSHLNTTSVFLALGGAWLLLNDGFRAFLCSIGRDISESKKGFYLLVLVLSILFSLGPIIHFNGNKITYGPYIFLYKFFPGFSGLRVPARFIIMTELALSVFAAFGMARLCGRLKTGVMKVLVTSAVSGLILLESASMPLPMPSVAVGDDVPEVYRWLGKEKGDFAILELPLPKAHKEAAGQTKYIYYSTYHWKRLINGYSGYFPQSFYFLFLEGMKDFPSPASVGLLRELDIKYLIIHSGEYGAGEFEKIEGALTGRADVLKLSKQFGPDYVYEVSRPVDMDTGKELARGGMKASASAAGAELALDGDSETRWTTGAPQRPSDYFETDFGEVKKLSGIILELGPDFWDYPRGYMIELSADGRTWKKVKSEPDAVAPLRSFIKNPNKTDFAIPFGPASGRYVRITQTGSGMDKPWSVREVRFFE